MNIPQSSRTLPDLVPLSDEARREDPVNRDIRLDCRNLCEAAEKVSALASRGMAPTVQEYVDALQELRVRTLRLNISASR